MGAHAVRLSNVDIDNALKNKEFEVLFQPIFDLGNGALARVEAFVRWRHPKLGVLPPGAFISFFETQGRMSELTRYVLSGAISSYLDWRGPSAPGFSINLALSDLGDDAFANHFTKVMRDNDFPADLITLECPMPRVDLELEAAKAQFEILAKTGARLAIEVRGRANDLLRNIDPFPFDEIKTGGSAILRFARTVRGPGLSAIADLLDIANRSNAAITAVGVEDQASLAALRGLGFTAVQGNHLAKVAGLDGIRPTLVNDVRKLLELEPLGADSLAALFRTEAPDPGSSEQNETQAVDDEALPADASSSERDASADENTDAATGATTKSSTQGNRSKAQDAKKAAAIDRAKAKLARARQKARRAAQSGEQADSPFPPNAAPRDLQKRLSEEFSEGAPGEEITASLTDADDAEAQDKGTQDSEAAQKENADMPEKIAQSDTVTTPDNEADFAKADAQSAAEARSEIDDAVEAIPETQEAETDEIEFEMQDVDADDMPSEEIAAADTSEENADDNEPDAEASEPSEELAAQSDTEEHREEPVNDLSFSIGAARAYFQPGMRVGNPELRSSTDSPIPASEAQPAASRGSLHEFESLRKTQPSQEADDVQSAETADLSAWISDDKDADPIELIADDETTAETTAEAAEDTQSDLEETQADAPDTEQAPGRFDYIDVEEPIEEDKEELAQDQEEPVQGDLHSEVTFEVEDTVAAPAPRKRRRKNFLTRKYRLMPTHFWPKSWKRHWREKAVEKAERKAAKEAEKAQALEDDNTSPHTG